MPLGKLKTVKVKCTDREDGVMLINEKDYDKEKHGALIREKVIREHTKENIAKG